MMHPHGRQSDRAYVGLTATRLVSERAQTQRSCILEAIFDQLSDAVFLYDRDLQVVGVNRAAERLFGMAADEIIGKNCQDLLNCSAWEPDSGKPRVVCQPERLPSDAVNLHLKNGRQRTVVVRTVEIHDDADVIEGVVATIKDITEESQPEARRIIAESPAMLTLLTFVRRVAVSEAASILIEGENGTGKDVIAKALHYQSPRQSEPFLAINCAAIPEALLESELFGYEKGAFTDAQAQKRGLFELADKGTLFLDEIGEMPLSLQAKLLRALENHTFRRLGGLKDIKVDIRIIAASNRNLIEAVKHGTFRQDLYYRLNVIQLVVPPLRERVQDILPLAHFFIEHYNTKFKRQIGGLSTDAQNLMLVYDWPGNVRELRNAIERAMILEDSALIQPVNLHIVTRVYGIVLASAAAGSSSIPSDGMSLREQERRIIEQALARTRGNQSKAADFLQITRDTLRYKMKKLGVH